MIPLPSTDPSDIANAARCFSSCVPGTMQSALRTYLLTQVANIATPPCITPASPVIAVLPGLTTNTSITVAWNFAGNQGSLVNGYEVFWGTASGVYTNNSGRLPPGPVNLIHSYMISGLTPGTPYFIVVVALTTIAGCQSANSNEVSATTSGAEPGPCAAGVTYVTGPYAANLVANAATSPSAAVQTALENFYCGLVTDGILNSILWMDISVPTVIGSTNSNAGGRALAGSPFLFPKGTTGTGGVVAPPQAASGAIPAQLNIQGARARVANPDFYNTGFNISTDFPSAQSSGWFVFATEVSLTGAAIGALASPGNRMSGLLQYTDGKAYGQNGLTGTNEIIVTPSPGRGFYSDQRISNVDHRFFFANEATPFAQIGATDAVAFNGTFPNLNAYAFGQNLSGTGLVAPSGDMYQAYGFTSGMTSAQVNNLYTRLRTLFIALGVSLSNGLTSGLVSFWKLETSSGTDVVSGNNFTTGGGAVAGGGIFGTTTFAGGSATLTPCPANLQLGAGKSFTVSCWCNGAGGASQEGVIAQFNNVAATSGWIVYMPAGTSNLQLGGFTGGVQATLANFGTLSAAWHHVVFGFDSPNQQLFAYFDGGAKQTQGTTGDLNGTNAELKAMSVTGQAQYGGAVNEIGFWNRVLSAADVAALYGAGIGMQFGGFTA